MPAGGGGVGWRLAGNPPPACCKLPLPHMPACPASCHVQTRHCSPACCSLQAAPDLRGRRPLGPTRHAPHVSAGGSARQPEGAAAASAGGFVQRWEGQQLIGVPPTHPTHLNPTHATHHPQPTFTATQSLNQLTCRPTHPRQAVFQSLGVVRSRGWYADSGTAVLLYRGAWQVRRLCALLAAAHAASGACVRAAGSQRGIAAGSLSSWVLPSPPCMRLFVCGSGSPGRRTWSCTPPAHRRNAQKHVRGPLSPPHEASRVLHALTTTRSGSPGRLTWRCPWGRRKCSSRSTPFSSTRARRTAPSSPAPTPGSSGSARWTATAPPPRCTTGAPAGAAAAAAAAGADVIDAAADVVDAAAAVAARPVPCNLVPCRSNSTSRGPLPSPCRSFR